MWLHYIWYPIRVWHTSEWHLSDTNCTMASPEGTIFEPSMISVYFYNLVQLGKDSQQMRLELNETSKFIPKPISYVAALHLVPNHSVAHQRMAFVGHKLQHGLTGGNCL